MKFSPILLDLRQREIGFGDTMNILRFNQKVLRKLACQENTTFERHWTYCGEKSNSRPYYESDKVYWDDFRKCFITCGFKGGAKPLYDVSSDHRDETIKDFLFCHTFNLIGPTPNDDTFRSSILAVTKNNWLLRLDCESGKTLQKIFLSDRTRFQHISWETVGHSIVLKSISYCQRNVRRASTTSDTLKFAFMIFDLFPLRFRVHFEIQEQVFSKDVCEAQVFEGILMVGFKSGRGTVCIYNLRTVIDNVRHEFEQNRSQTITPSRGLPVNLEILDLPPLLLTVKCGDNDLAFDGYPWQYISRVVGKINTFQVSTLDPPHVIVHGTLEYGSYHIEPDGATFHEDNSGRIIHYSATEFRVLKLVSTGDCPQKLETIYTILFDELLAEPTRQDTFSSSGRKLTRNPRSDIANEAYKHSLLSFHYEDELDLLAILISNPSSSYGNGYRLAVHIYNNATGGLIKKMGLSGQSTHSSMKECLTEIFL